jgi:hypothetical protein
VTPALLAAGGLSATETTVVSLVISGLVLVWFLYRQLQVRRAATSLAIPAVLIVVGVVTLTGGGPTGLGSARNVLILIALLAGDAIGLGAVRALTLRLWRSGDTIMRQGTWLTAGLWLAGAAVHYGVDAVAGISESTVLIYLGVTLIAQRLVLQMRARDPAQLPQTASGGDAPGLGARFSG